MLEALKKAAIEQCKAQTGLTDIELEKHEDITIAVLAMIADMWDNRDMVANNDKENRIVRAILDSHRKNLLPSAGVI